MYVGNGQLRKKVLEAGSGPDSKPQRGQNVSIDLKTTLTDGTTLEEESSISFTLGDGDVIQVHAFGLKKFWVSSSSVRLQGMPHVLFNMSIIFLLFHG